MSLISIKEATSLSDYNDNIKKTLVSFLLKYYSEQKNKLYLFSRGNNLPNIFLLKLALPAEFNKKKYDINLLVYFPINFPSVPPEIFFHKYCSVKINPNCLNYIDARVLPLFERKDLNYDQRQVLRYNIETILECCGESKKLFRKYYYPEVLSKKKELNRQKSMEVLKNFRKEYGLKEEDYCNEGLIHRLVENDYNMQRTFQKMFQ